jgi:predicted permease
MAPLIESLLQDIRYALRGVRRSPLFAASVAATIGLGLGVLSSAFTVLNAYVFRPVNLPDPYAIHAFTWDTESSLNHRFTLADVESMRQNAPVSGLVAVQPTLVSQEGAAQETLLVTGDYFQIMGGRAVLGRTLLPSDAPAPGGEAVVVISEGLWRARFSADPSIVGKPIVLGQQRFTVVGVMPLGYGLGGEATIGVWAPLTMARALGATDPWSDPNAATLNVIARLRDGTSAAQARAWFDIWLRQRFPTGSEQAPVAVRVESRATTLTLNGPALTLFSLIVAAFGLVLLVACANVTNLVLARAFRRHREIAVRLSLGASRWRVARQLVIESLVLAVPASLVGLALTFVTARAFPALIIGTFPPGAFSVDLILPAMDPDVRVIALLSIAAALSAVLVSVVPSIRVTRANLAHASRGDASLDGQRSRLRTGLVALQIGACVLFLVGATSLVDQSRRMASPDVGFSYERVGDMRVAPALRRPVAERLMTDPAVEGVAAAWQSPMNPLRTLGVIASGTRIETPAGFLVVSPEFFTVFEIPILRGRAFTEREAKEGAGLVLVSDATARLLWPGLDPIGQTLEVQPAGRDSFVRRPNQTSVRVVGVVRDVSRMFGAGDGPDPTCIYFPTTLDDPGDLAVLVKARSDVSAARTAITATVEAVQPGAPVRFLTLRGLLGIAAWVFDAFFVTASVLGGIGLVLAFSGTYAVVAFLVTQRTREFGIRLALGATARQIIVGIVREMARISMVGVAAGALLAVAVTRLFGGTIPFIPPITLRPYVVGISIVVVATLAAALLPSLRTTRIDPSKALRTE